MIYTLIISEEQRLALLALLKGAEVGGNGDDEAPLVYWQGMLEELPEMEAATPGVHHGFCL